MLFHPMQARNALRSALLDRAKTDFTTVKISDLPPNGKKKLHREVGATWQGLIGRSGSALHWIPSDYG